MKFDTSIISKLGDVWKDSTLSLQFHAGCDPSKVIGKLYKRLGPKCVHYYELTFPAA